MIDRASYLLVEALRTAIGATAPTRTLIGQVLARLANDPLRAFDLLYTIATSESNRIYSAQALAAKTVRRNGELLDEYTLQRLLLVQAVAAGSAGAAFSVGSIMTLPAASLFSMYIKTISVAAIAHLAGHDLTLAATKAKIRAIVVGETEASTKYRDVVVDGSKVVIEQFALTFCRKAATISRLGKVVPFVGASLSGTLEMLSIRTVSKRAIAQFLTDQADQTPERLNCCS